jgi:hypothetical protein
MERIGFVDTQSILSQIEDLENSKAHGGTTMDMTGKNLFIKWISYLFRPFFFDARNLLGAIISIENLVWVFIFFKILRNLRNRIAESFRNVYWFSLFSFFAITIPAAYLLYNLGIAVRQKTMIVPFFFVLFFLTKYKHTALK